MVLFETNNYLFIDYMNGF